MATQPPPTRNDIGSNFPPLDPPERLATRLELEQAEFIQRAMKLDMDSYGLPERPATDEDASILIDWEVERQKLAREVEKTRVAVGRPYLEAQRVANEFAKEIVSPLDARAKVIVSRVDAYRTAKREAEDARRREQERLEREKAQALAKEQREAEQAAEAARQTAAKAAEAIRAAETQEARDAAESQMREANAIAAEQSQAAEQAAEGAAQAGRVADAVEKSLDPTKMGQASKVSAGGGSASGTTVWRGQITDADKLMASLGPLGPGFLNDDITSAIARLVKGGARDLPGVTIRPETETSIRAKRPSKS